MTESEYELVESFRRYVKAGMPDATLAEWENEYTETLKIRTQRLSDNARALRFARRHQFPAAD